MPSERVRAEVVEYDGHEGYTRELRMTWSGVTPHWENTHTSPGDRKWATLECRGHVNAGWVMMDAMEHGAKSSRRTMLTLSNEEREKLALYLLRVHPVSRETMALLACVEGPAGPRAEPYVPRTAMPLLMGEPYDMKEPSPSDGAACERCAAGHMIYVLASGTCWHRGDRLTGPAFESCTGGPVVP